MKVIIVGGGIAGLAAGIYARQSGMDAAIYEMHSIPGGNSTSWKRKGYLFEGGMHWLVGSSEKAPLHRLWREVGALQDNNPIHIKDPFITYMGENGPVCLYRDPQRLRDHLLSVSPGDRQAIDALVKDIRALSKMSMPVMDVKGVRVKRKTSPPLSMLFSMIGALPRMNKLHKIGVEEYAARFKHAGIRTLLEHVVKRDDYSADSVAFTLGGLAAGDAGYPTGGSLRMAQNMADTFTALGGEILYGQRVERVEVEEGVAKGVWVNGVLQGADAVIVTADTRAAIDTLFSEPLDEPWMADMRRDTIPVNNVFVSVGVKADLSALPECMVFPLEQPLQNGRTTHHTIEFYNYARYKGYAPAGCTSLTCFFSEDTYDEWKAARDEGTYDQKKEELARQVIDWLARAVPETAGKAEVWDVATPLTYERYCGSWRGSWMSVMTPGSVQRQYPSKPDTIRNLYFAGQRLMLPGGLPVALSTGRRAVQYLCKDRDRVFQSEWE